MKSVIFINNKFHQYDEDRLKFEIQQLEWYLNRNEKNVCKVLIVNSNEELDIAKKYLINTDELQEGDGVITLELSDISNDDNEIKNFILELYSRGITFRAFHEFFNTENEREKSVLLNCLDWLCSVELVEGNIPF